MRTFFALLAVSVASVVAGLALLAAAAAWMSEHCTELGCH